MGKSGLEVIHLEVIQLRKRQNSFVYTYVAFLHHKFLMFFEEGNGKQFSVTNQVHF